jgi:hypothetical protein
LALEKSADQDTPSALARWARIGWGVVVNLVELAVILAVLNSGADAFVVPALIIIYLAISTGFASLGTAAWALSIKSDRQFATLAKRLNDPEHSAYLAGLNADETRMRTAQTRLGINVSFRAIEWIAAVGYLLSAL